jgi:hypothetical protein
MENETKQKPGGSGVEDVHGSAATLDQKPQPAMLNTVSVKIPAFTETFTDCWFSILEAQFVTSRINSNQTKFYHALQGLPPSVVSSIPSEILNAANYEMLK